MLHRGDITCQLTGKYNQFPADKNHNDYDVDESDDDDDDDDDDIPFFTFF